MMPDSEIGAERADRSRLITDPEGRPWVVREVEPPDYDRRAVRSLIFLADDIMRRVRHYPADWFERSDDELYALSFGR